MDNALLKRQMCSHLLCIISLAADVILLTSGGVFLFLMLNTGMPLLQQVGLFGATVAALCIGFFGILVSAFSFCFRGRSLRVLNIIFVFLSTLLFGWLVFLVIWSFMNPFTVFQAMNRNPDYLDMMSPLTRQTTPRYLALMADLIATQWLSVSLLVIATLGLVIHFSQSPKANLFSMGTAFGLLIVGGGIWLLLSALRIDTLVRTLRTDGQGFAQLSLMVGWGSVIIATGVAYLVLPVLPGRSFCLRIP